MKNLISTLVLTIALAVTSFGQFEANPNMSAVLGLDQGISTLITPSSSASPMVFEHSVSSPFAGPLAAIGGVGFSSYYLFVDSGPAVPFAATTPGGIFNLGTASNVLRYGTFQLNVPGGGCGVGTGAGGCGLDLFFIDTTGLPVGTTFSLQGAVLNSVLPANFQFTNPVQVTMTP